TFCLIQHRNRLTPEKSQSSKDDVTPPELTSVHIPKITRSRRETTKLNSKAGGNNSTRPMTSLPGQEGNNSTRGDG
ncbi:unnamed protein product, partial [Larinioides sclopetarius]